MYRLRCLRQNNGEGTPEVMYGDVCQCCYNIVKRQSIRWCDKVFDQFTLEIWGLASRMHVPGSKNVPKHAKVRVRSQVVLATDGEARLRRTADSTKMNLTGFTGV